MTKPSRALRCPTARAIDEYHAEQADAVREYMEAHYWAFAARARAEMAEVRASDAWEAFLAAADPLDARDWADAFHAFADEAQDAWQEAGRWLGVAAAVC